MAELSELTKAMIQQGSVKHPRWRLWVGIALLVLIIAGGTAGYWLTRPKPLPPLDSDPVTLVKFSATPQFARLDEGRKWEYIEKMFGAIPRIMQAFNEKKITDQERDSAMENTMTLVLRRRIEGYFKLPLGKERDQFIDKMIDEQEGFRPPRIRLWPGSTRPATRPVMPATRPPEKIDYARIKKMIEKMPPDLRAEAAEFFRAIRDRREARGLPPQRGPFGR